MPWNAVLEIAGLLGWLAIPPLSMIFIGRHYLGLMRYEANRLRSFVDLEHEDLDERVDQRIAEHLERMTPFPRTDPEATAQLPESLHLTNGQALRADHAAGRHRLQ